MGRGVLAQKHGLSERQRAALEWALERGSLAVHDLESLAPGSADAAFSGISG